MTVLVSAKVSGDTAAFRKALEERAGEFEKIAEHAKESGCIHHRFALGDTYVLVIDEWETAENFEKFFANPDLQAFIASVGGDTGAPPDITIAEAVDSADQF
jgi:quinol monooxygenase YgiN